MVLLQVSQAPSIGSRERNDSQFGVIIGICVTITVTLNSNPVNDAKSICSVDVTVACLSYKENAGVRLPHGAPFYRPVIQRLGCPPD
jgi:hypothetical protein